MTKLESRMSQLGESDSVEPVDQNQSPECAGSDPVKRISVTNEPGRSAEAAPAMRFGISHMMVWIACCGVYMGAVRFIWPEAIGQSIPGFVFLTALGSLSGGAFLGGLFIFAERRFRGATYPLHAGEWLLTVQGIRFATGLALSVAVRLVSGPTHVGWIVSSLLACWWFLWPALRSLDPPRWKIYFWLAFLIGLFEGLESFFLGWLGIGRIIFIGVLQLLPAGLLLGCVWLDLQVPLRRPWTHWAGVLAVLWGLSLQGITLAMVVVRSY